MVPIFNNDEDIERKSLLILRALSESPGPIGSRIIARRMQELGSTASERSVRYHLKIMDERRLTRLVGKRDGRVITERGLDELDKARVCDKVGLAISRIEILSYQTTFDPDARQGLLPVNLSFFRKATFPAVLKCMKPVFDAGFAVSRRVAVADEGRRLGGIVVPGGKIGLATVCSLVVNGVLLKHGIPMDSKFGGILQVKDRRPLRFAELIYYSGSSLDPSEIFIRGNMTSVGNAVQYGEGMILANFREIPAPCFDLTQNLLDKLQAADINGVLVMGEVSEPVCQIPVDINKMGIILLGGLNPAAFVREAGMDVDNMGMSTVMDYGDLLPYQEILEKFSS